MPNEKFGSNKYRNLGRGQEIQSLPERKVLTFRDFRRGYTPSEQRQMVDPAASPVTHDMEIREDNRIWRAPGTAFIESFAERQPYRLGLHPSLTGMVQLALWNPPEIGFRGSAEGPSIIWTNIGAADRSFASTTFGGTFIFSDGLRVWYRESHNAPIYLLEDAPPALSYVSFAGRVFAGHTMIDGRWEPLGIRWSAANSDYRDWDGFGSGFELLINDISSGDRIQALVPMSLDFLAVMMRHSIWVGRFTGQALRPVDFGTSPRTTGIGTVSGRTAKLSRFGVFFLSDNGVYLFDGNSATLISEGINAELLPLDYNRLEEYHAVYDPIKVRYVLFSPDGKTWIYEIEKERWLKRSFTSIDSVMFPSQVDPIRWFEILGNWLEQEEVRWVDLAGQNPGDLRLQMLGDQIDITGELRRVLVRESRRYTTYFGVPFVPYWETRLYDEQDSAKLVSSVKQLVEYEGEGCLRIYLPEEDNRYERVVEAILDYRDYPSTAVFNAQKVGKGTGIGIEFCDEVPEILPVPAPEFPYEEYESEYDPEFPDYEYEPEVEWTGFSIFSDVHSSTPVEDSQQSAPLELACFIWCDEPECGGTGGWVAWWTSDPEDLMLGCSSPNNPWGYLQ